MQSFQPNSEGMSMIYVFLMTMMKKVVFDMRKLVRKIWKGTTWEMKAKKMYLFNLNLKMITLKMNKWCNILTC
ncbi:Gamma-aminobutyric acid receptor subunit rho-3 [Bienertia sinuspersici]